jgi:hypothetical protein
MESLHLVIVVVEHLVGAVDLGLTLRYSERLLHGINRPPVNFLLFEFLNSFSLLFDSLGLNGVGPVRDLLFAYFVEIFSRGISVPYVIDGWVCITAQSLDPLEITE